jgi:hypothetical protein
MARHFWNWRLPVLAASLLLAVTAWGTAEAQYPPPTGNVTLTSSVTAPQMGDTITITALVRDVAGVAASGLACTFDIASQPGSDASVYPGPVLTDLTGVATTSLQVGSTAGPIIVGASCGELSAQVSVVLGTATAVQLPVTGEGPDGSQGGSGLPWLWVVLAAAMVAAGLLVARDAARRARR